MGRRPINSLAYVGIAALAAGGCTLAPKRFDQTNDHSPLVRARALTMNDDLPDNVVIPALIRHLDDPDPVVRLTAHEQLRKRTGQDLGYRPYDEEPLRHEAIGRWRAWWAQPSARPTPQQATRPQASAQTASGALQTPATALAGERGAGQP